MKNNEKYLEYAALLHDHIASVINDPDCEYYIGKLAVTEEENFKHFIHALATTVPNMFWNKITGNENNNLEFNHIANHFVFEFASISKGEETSNEQTYP